MSTQQEALYALQRLDTDLLNCRALLRSLQAELADESSVITARRSLENGRQELARLEAEQRQNEQHVTALTRTIASLQKRLFDGSVHNAREAESTEEELKHRRQDLAQAEDATLASMEQFEEAQNVVPRLETYLRETEEARAARVIAIKKQGQAETVHHRELQARRLVLAEALSKVLFAQYEARSAQTSPAVVAIHQGCCGSCGVTFPTSLAQRVDQGEISTCPSCGRYIVAAEVERLYRPSQV